ncbi:MAG: prepilin-type N-terminal cleavage/methylation domain-containing protein [Planctomycetota bacterium]|jgi:prepilin-type N-terminal cleavage/methylation domain-containing protein
MIPRSSQRGFSLLEVMIATAILAASAMVLLSLISLGTRFGSKAEMRIGALVQAQSILDESILRMHSGESIESYTGVLAGSVPRSYRVTVEPFEVLSQATTGNTPPDGKLGPDPQGLETLAPGSNPTKPMPSELVSIKVELYESEGATSGMPTGGKAGAAKPLVELTRLVRRKPVLPGQGPGSSTGSAIPVGGRAGI